MPMGIQISAIFAAMQHLFCPACILSRRTQYAASRSAVSRLVQLFRSLKPLFGCFSLLYGVLLIAPEKVNAQNSPVPTDSLLWVRIQAQMEKNSGDTTFRYIIDEVNTHCGNDAPCLLTSYQYVANQLERAVRLEGAIAVTGALIQTGEKEGQTEILARGHLNLHRFYDALRNTRLAVYHLDMALRYYEQLGNSSMIILCKYRKIVQLHSAEPAELEQTCKTLESLIEEVILAKDTALAGDMLNYLISLNLYTDAPEKSKSHFDLFERIMNPDTKSRRALRYWSVFWKNKGDFAKMQGTYNTTKECYLKSLEIAERADDNWLELDMKIHLTELDWQLGNHKEAKTRLEQALIMSEAVNSDELFATVFRIAAQIAEAEGRHKDALDYYKKMSAIQLAIEQSGNKNIAENYYLAVENENSGLKLHLRNNQLRFTIAIFVLVSLLALGLFGGLYKQRQSKRKLARQNALIQQQTEQLKSLDEAKSRFFANVSHELRTPLTLLTSPIHTLLKNNHLSEKQTQLLQIAARSGQQLAQLINEILDLRKLEMGQMTLRPEPTPLHAWFQTYFAQFESLATQKQIEYKVLVDMPKHLVADLDREKCRQIVFNLLSNAFKFTPQGGRIEVQAAYAEQGLELRVANTGAGIHPDDIPHIFDRYFQTSRPDKPVEGGTGIGLALCREYAQLFGGSIHAASTPGVNTVFQVSFPLPLADADATLMTTATVAPEEAGTIPLVGTPSTVSDTDRATILLVEDNPDLQAYIQLVLKEKYHVVTAGQGQEAWTFLKAENTAKPLPDLILSDLMMPVMDGYQLLERLKSDDATRHIPVVMLTARAEAQDKLKALRIGVDDYLTKPFDEEELLARIENLLNNQAARRMAQSTEAPAAEPGKASPPLHAQPDREWLEAFEAYVQKHYAGGALSVSSLAYEFAMSESTLLRQLKRLTGLSPIQYIQEVRLSEARKLLENRTYNSVAQVASKVGYDDARSFTRSFKQRFGKLPSELMEG
jgi:signal transduction histidine kinase/DNA-binding response OmpR family regulator